MMRVMKKTTDKHIMVIGKKRALIILVLGFMILLSIGFSEARLGNFPRRSCVEIQTISNSSAVNISSLLFVNGSKAVSNQPMDKSGKTFNYTFCQTEEIGVYLYDYFDAEGNVFVNDFLITPIGDEITTGSSILYIIILLAVSILFAFFLIIAIQTPYENIGELTERGPVILRVTKTKYVKLMASWISYGMFMWIITIITGMTNNYIRFEELRILTTNLYFFLNLLGWGISALIIWLTFYNIWKDIILNKTILKEGKALLRSLN